MLTEIFWSFFMTSIIGCLLGIIRMLYKSKCSLVECCWCKIIRDVETEEKETEFIYNHTQNKNNNEVISNEVI